MFPVFKKFNGLDRTLLAFYDYSLGLQGNSILLSHATGFHGRVFDKTASFLKDNFRCASIDHRGHGRSSFNPNQLPEMNVLGQDLLCLTSELVQNQKFSPKFLGVGHSKGATALIRAAIASPETFRGLIIFEPAIFPTYSKTPGESPLAIVARRRKNEFNSYSQALQNFSMKPPLNCLDPDVLGDYIHYGLYDPINENFPIEGSFPADFDFNKETLLKLRCHPEREADVYNCVRSDDTWDQIHKLSVPVFLINSTDQFSPLSKVSNSLAKIISNVNLITWNDCGHFGPLEKPERFADVIKEVDRSIL